MIRMLRRWWWLVLVIPMAVGLARLRFDAEVLDLLPTDLPVVQGLKLYQEHFAHADELLVTVEADSAEDAQMAARQLALGLRARTNLVARVIWRSPWQEHPEQTAELIALTWLNQPPEIFQQLADRLTRTNLPTVLESTRHALATSLSPEEIARLSYDPFSLTQLPDSATNQSKAFGQGEELFASADGKFRILYVNPSHALRSYRDCSEWMEQIKHVVAQIRAETTSPASTRFGFTGAPAFIAETSSGMEHDLRNSAAGTLLIIALLFWWAHRRWLPLLWLVVLLSLVLLGTLALGSLFFGRLNVVSLGFAAILLGLAVDYALVLYQEAIARSGKAATDTRREVAPGILWSAFTTAGAFALLNFGALPGLAQLGTLVALGVLLGAGTMLGGFLPVALKRWRPTPIGNRLEPKARSRNASYQSRFAWPITLVLIAAVIIILVRHWPALDHTAEALSPTTSPAYRAMETVKSHLTHNGEPLWLLISGRDESEVAQRMQVLQNDLASDEAKPWVQSVTFPSALWPRPERQAVNRATAARLAARRDELHNAARAAGFTDQALALTDAILQTWQRVAQAKVPLWPTDEANRWMIEKVAAKTTTGWLALGIVQPAKEPAVTFAGLSSVLGGALSRNGAWLTGWPVLGEALLEHTEARLPWLMAAMLAFVACCLWIAFGTAREMLLSFATLAVSLLCLLAIMSLLGWSWNLMNLMAAPLLLGAGVDYTIHTQLALRRHGGNAAAMRRSTGRALLLCAGTTLTGFGSLAWAGNAGLASLGQVCAAGVACVFGVSLGLLPAWWQRVQPAVSDAPSAVPAKPSSFYRTDIWLLGLFVGRVLPRRLSEMMGRALALLYYHSQPRRREVVIQNLLPVAKHDRPLAERAARDLFQQFALKVGDLWRYESGVAVDRWLTDWSGWETFTAAQARGKGVLLVTPHLGNWEFGGAFLAKDRYKLLVLTQPEPEQRLTQLRQNSRARWGIETLVVGEDAFAFVEIIKRLQAGAIVALLVDRPAPSTAVTVELFGQPFHASVAAAELARASGCAVIPVYIVRQSKGYSANILPEVAYDRAALGNRTVRTAMTQEIMSAFEPIIRQHVVQWYHFVPIWPDGSVPPEP